MFGARKLNANEDSENLLGYDLYSSALADMLTEPTLSMPITVSDYICAILSCVASPFPFRSVEQLQVEQRVVLE